MIVMKFGGTSIGDPASLARVVEIIRSRLDLRPVIVNSAMGKTTRKLLAIATTAAQGESAEAKSRLDELYGFHRDMARSLLKHFDASEAREKLAAYYGELLQVIEVLPILEGLSLRNQDKILSYGELMATSIVASALREAGIDSRLTDARDFIITDGAFSRARPIEGLTRQRIVQFLLPIVEAGSTPVVQGFIGSTEDGATTTLGFEGSDFTATLVGAALNLADIEIWKDVNGIMTADPAVFEGARTVKVISFDEAAELTRMGAKVLHPATISPARENNISVHIFNSKEPEATGTVITAESKHGGCLFKSIAYKRPVCLLRISSFSADNSLDTFRSASKALDRADIELITSVISDRNIALVVGDAENIHNAIDGIAYSGEIDIKRGKATVSLVGEDLGIARRVPSLILKKLDGIDIDMVVYGQTSFSITFVIDQMHLSMMIDRLHRGFLENPDPEIFG